jgi:antitoxin YefM
MTFAAKADEYNSLIETNYLLGDEGNAAHLSRSIEQYGSGKATERESLENHYGK